ncbi:MAG: hypothetical protein H6711_25400 [Myxococcales bacterium]|nr:hypothetical protein [Myxococcales bacterium]
MALHVIFTDATVFLSRCEYASWREVQDDFAGYKASLGPWSPAEVIEYLRDDHPDLVPDATTQVEGFLRSGDEVTELTFADG